MSGEKDSLISGVEEALYKLSDRIRFNQLVDQVEKISFGYNPDYTDHSDDSDDYIMINLDGPDEEFIEIEINGEGHKEIEAKIIAQLGVYGLRTAFDHFTVDWSYDHLKDKDHPSELDREVCPDSVLRLPLRFNQSTDFEVAHRAKQFGEVLLHKSFACLGPDAPQKARQLSMATSEEEQLEIILWLHGRLFDMSHNKHGIDTSEDDFDVNDGLYHPARLSPMAIGKYPQIDLSPTCLGVSVLAASFFERAGLKHLHAGVMQTNLEAEDYLISDTLSRHLDSLPEHMQPYLKSVTRNVFKRSQQDYGFHAGNVVQLASGRWLQFDSNFDSIGFTYQDSIDQKYDDLVALKDVAPGLELGYVDYRTVAAGVTESIENIQDIQYDDTGLVRALLESDEAIESSLHQAIMPEIKALLFADDHNGLEREFLEDSLDQAFSKCLERLVLWNNPIDEVRQRCLKDPAFLSRTIEDLKNIWKPTLLLMLVAVRDNQRETLQQNTHAQLELGLPAQRIGLAVLNDYDSYLNSGLSANFWLNNWPSQVPRIEAAERFKDLGDLGDSNEHLPHTVTNNSTWILTSILRYTKSDRILYSYLKDQGAENLNQPEEWLNTTANQ